jgi:hypothetical protein
MESQLITPITDAEKTFAMLAKLSNNIKDLIGAIANDEIDVDEWLSIYGAPGTLFTLKPNFVSPIVVDYILAVFPTTSTSVVITLGTRVITVSDIAAGVFTADLRMQLEMEDPRIMQIAPAGLGHFEIMGHVANRKQDWPNP